MGCQQGRTECTHPTGCQPQPAGCQLRHAEEEEKLEGCVPSDAEVQLEETLPVVVKEAQVLQRLHAWMKGREERGRAGGGFACPASVGDMLALEGLSLGRCEIAAVPAELGRLTALRRLQLQENWLRSIPPELGLLASLHYLDVSENLLTDVPVEIGQLSALENLHLNRNQLYAIPSELGQLLSLHSLHLEDNKLRSLPHELSNLSLLECLNLGNNVLESLPLWLNDLPKLHCLSVAGNRLRGPFPLQPLLLRLALLRGAKLELSGNFFAPQDCGDEQFTSGELRDVVTESCGDRLLKSSACVASFCGEEFPEWQLLLLRVRAQEEAYWSQLCVFLPEYATALLCERAPLRWHASGLGSDVCRAFGCYFDAADAFTGGRASKAHKRFGCCWFRRWAANVSEALARGHRRFVVFTKLDRTLGTCQAVEWLYLLDCQRRHPDLELRCALVSEAEDVLRFGVFPAAWEGRHALARFTALARPAGLPRSLPPGLAEALDAL